MSARYNGLVDSNIAGWAPPNDDGGMNKVVFGDQLPLFLDADVKRNASENWPLSTKKRQIEPVEPGLSLG